MCHLRSHCALWGWFGAAVYDGFFAFLGSFRSYKLAVAGSGIPANAVAFASGLAVVQCSQGYVTMWPAGTARPRAAVLVYEQGLLNMGSVYQVLASNGQFNVFVSGSGHVVLDINGYFAPAGGGLWYQPLANPIRIVDTRTTGDALYKATGPVAANTVFNRPFRATSFKDIIIPEHACAVSTTIAMLPLDYSGFLTVWPGPNQVRNSSLTCVFLSSSHLLSCILTCITNLTGYQCSAEGGSRPLQQSHDF